MDVALSSVAANQLRDKSLREQRQLEAWNKTKWLKQYTKETAGIQDFYYYLDCEKQTLELTWTKFMHHTLMFQECVYCCTTHSCHLIWWWLRLGSHYLHSLSLSINFTMVLMAKMVAVAIRCDTNINLSLSQWAERSSWVLIQLSTSWDLRSRGRHFFFSLLPFAHKPSSLLYPYMVKVLQLTDCTGNPLSVYPSSQRAAHRTFTFIDFTFLRAPKSCCTSSSRKKKKKRQLAHACHRLLTVSNCLFCGEEKDIKKIMNKI